MPTTPHLRSTRSRLRAWRRGELDVLVADYGLSRRNGRIDAEALYKRPSCRRPQRAHKALLPLLHKALRRSPNQSMMRLNSNAVVASHRPAAPGSRLPVVALPAYLVSAGADRYGRQTRLAPAAAAALKRMRAVAAADGINLEIVSGFRSPAYQAGIWARKQRRGQSLAEIGKVSAPPGRSEHHSGRAVDLAFGPGPVLEQSFAKSAAYRWLKRHAPRFGFFESYPANNPYGIIAEPWHWCWLAPTGGPGG